LESGVGDRGYTIIEAFLDQIPRKKRRIYKSRRYFHDSTNFWSRGLHHLAQEL